MEEDDGFLLGVHLGDQVGTMTYVGKNPSAKEHYKEKLARPDRTEITCGWNSAEGIAKEYIWRSFWIYACY